MARYEYECPNCGTFEVTQRFSDAPLETHDCGARVERKISMTAFTLKGTGWAADGYRSSSPSRASAGEACTPAGCAKPGCAAKEAAN